MESVDGNEGAPQNAAPTPSTRRFLHTLLGKPFTVSLATKIVAANVAVDIIKEFNAEAAQHVVPLKSNANYVEFKEIVENLSAGAKFLIECAVPAVRGSVPAPGSSTATLNSTASSSSSPAAAMQRSRQRSCRRRAATLSSPPLACTPALLAQQHASDGPRVRPRHLGHCRRI